jgi:putative transposase
MADPGDRKNLRLENWDYSRSGAYFATVCTKDRKNFLSEISSVGAIHESPAVRLTKYGQIVDRYIGELPRRYPEIVVDKYVIMPNHVHILMQIVGERAIRESPLRALVGTVIGYLKMNASKEMHLAQPGIQVWQRGYYDHVIRNEADYQTIWRYIDDNPAKWEEDKYFLDTEI